MNNPTHKIPGGLLIAFEGIDGCGKTSMAKAAAQHFTALGYHAVYLREPTDGPHGRQLRQLMISDQPRDAQLEFDLFILDRKEDVQLKINPVLEAGGIVCIDRYYISSMAYQGALGLDPQFIRHQNEQFAPQPDLILFFDVCIDTAIQRINQSRPAGTNNFEQRENLEKVCKIFHSLDFPQLLPIDANQNFIGVKADTLQIIQDFISAKSTNPEESQP